MEKSMKILLVVVFLSCFTIQNSYAIKCWKCKSDTDPNCGESFNSSAVTLTDCSLELPNLDRFPLVQPNACQKTIQTDIYSGKQSIVRTCGYLSPESSSVGECEKSEPNNKIRIHFCQLCSDNDYCNSAPMLLSKNIFVHLIAFLFAAIIGNYINF